MQVSSASAGRFCWTKELHNKFEEAVQILGPNATPSTIQNLMKVKEVSRKQISSHLQRYRKKDLKNKNHFSQQQASEIATENPIIASDNSPKKYSLPNLL